MKTICLDLTDAELASLRAEPQDYVRRLALPHEHLTIPPPGMTSIEEILFGKLPERMTRRVTVDPESNCWIVSGHGTGKGHAKVSIAGRNRQFHRVVWQLHKGPIPAGHVLDHVKTRGCRHRNCANFNHLEPVTVKENTDRGDGTKFQFKRKDQ